MKSNIQKILLIVLFFNLTAYASPEEDLEIFRDHFKKRFPGNQTSENPFLQDP